MPEQGAEIKPLPSFIVIFNITEKKKRCEKEKIHKDLFYYISFSGIIPQLLLHQFPKDAVCLFVHFHPDPHYLPVYICITSLFYVLLASLLLTVVYCTGYGLKQDGSVSLPCYVIFCKEAVYETIGKKNFSPYA